MKKTPLILIIIYCFSSACTDIQNVINPGDKPVIEAFLAPGHLVSMKVFTEIPYSSDDNNVSTMIEGLSIEIAGDNGQIFTLLEQEKGIYNSTEILGESGTNYTMSFLYNGRTIEATTGLPAKPIGYEMSISELERIERDFTGGFNPGGGLGPGGGGFQQESQTSLTLNWNNDENVYFFVAAQLNEELLDPVVDFPNNENGFSRPPRRFNNEPIQSTTSSISPQQFEYFGEYNIILYRLNPDYAALYENNNTSSQNISTPISTITNGLGIFTGINADTLKLNVIRTE